MGYTLLHAFLWLVTAFRLTTQDLASLSVIPRVTAACGQQVTLHCDVSSSQHGLSIKHLSWSQNQKTLCSVDGSESIIKHPGNFKSNFTCVYQQGQFSLILEEVQPMASGNSKPFRCKLHSNKGAADEYTTVELQECVGKVEGVWKNGGPTCKFSKVYPDGEVQWFDPSHRLSPKHSTSMRVEDGGWLSFVSSLEKINSKGPYNCSLRSTKTGEDMASTLVEEKTEVGRSKGTSTHLQKMLCILVLVVIVEF